MTNGIRKVKWIFLSMPSITIYTSISPHFNAWLLEWSALFESRQKHVKSKWNKHPVYNCWTIYIIQYILRNMHTVFALLCFVVVIHWLIFQYPSVLLHWHCGNLTIAPVPAKQPWWIWINTSCEFIMNDCITTTKQSTTNPCAYFLGYTVWVHGQFSLHQNGYLVIMYSTIWCELITNTSVISEQKYTNQREIDSGQVL